MLNHRAILAEWFKGKDSYNHPPPPPHSGRFIVVCVCVCVCVYYLNW